MASMRAGVVSLLRRAFAARRPPLGMTSCSFSSSVRCLTAVSVPSSLRHSGSSSRVGPQCSSSGSSKQQHKHKEKQQQRSGLSTLRRGLSGPHSARLRLPMRGLEEFRDPEVVKAGDVPIVGRNWSVQELRRKSFEDLHKLWFVLYKEKNMLQTQVVLSRRSKVPIPAGDRRQKVKRSMKAIKVVVGERQRVKRAVIHERQMAAQREKREAAAAAAAAAAESEEAALEEGKSQGAATTW
ncbi:unnamed protein product [Pylaiella littoralis]